MERTMMAPLWARRTTVLVVTAYWTICGGGLLPTTMAYRVYEKVKTYEAGDRLPLVAQKFTSPQKLTSMDYPRLPQCDTFLATPLQLTPANAWNKALEALHGDVQYVGPPYAVDVLLDVYCGQLCVLDFDNTHVASNWKHSIRQDFRAHLSLDGVPVAVRWDDGDYLTTSYWSGVPLGRRGGVGVTPNVRYDNATSHADLYVNNHWNIEIEYYQTKSGGIQVAHATIEPHSIFHVVNATNALTTTGISKSAVAMASDNSTIPSCQADADWHTSFEQLVNVSAPLQPPRGLVVFTYDVTWKRTNTDPTQSRWDVFLTMDDGVPAVIQVASLVLGIFINAVLLGVLYTWVMRDLSYKPLWQEVEDVHDEPAAREIQLWPLSTRTFFAPAAGGRGVLAACMGTGAQLVATGVIFLFFFQIGVINLSGGAQVLSAAAIVFAATSVVGGYATAWFYKLVRGANDYAGSIKVCLVTWSFFPLTGLVIVGLCYDAFPASSVPTYHAFASSFPLILLWLAVNLPLTLVGGWLGWRGRELSSFPISDGSHDYQEFTLQSGADKADAGGSRWTRCWRRSRTTVLFLTCGLLPILCCFVPYSYGVAGPVYLGYWVSARLMTLLPFCLFLLASGAVVLLVYYRQIRLNNHAWWWMAFLSGASSGFYVFLLSMTWLLFNERVNGLDNGTFAVYFFWFLYIAMAAFFMCGFVAVACCVLFNRKLYIYAQERTERHALYNEMCENGADAGELDFGNDFTRDDELIVGVAPASARAPESPFSSAANSPETSPDPDYNGQSSKNVGRRKKSRRPKGAQLDLSLEVEDKDMDEYGFPVEISPEHQSGLFKRDISSI